MFAAAMAAVLSVPAGPAVNGVADPGLGARYAARSLAVFDNDDEVFKPRKKEPKWFAFINGPEKDTAAEQFAWCAQCEAEGSAGAARRGYDALVREWPTAPEAPRAQQRLAELELSDLDYEAAFAEFRYLLDFYSAVCDYSAIAAKMYQVAELMREEGKRVLFVRFANTVDVRRAYESLVARAPGAPFAPRAMLTIAALREDEQKDDKAIAVYECLRNLHPGAPEAAEALVREAAVRMRQLEKHDSNRSRVRDTADFLQFALRGDLADADRRQLGEWLAEVRALLEREAWEAARFYDSRTRTRRSALSAYEMFLADYPDGVHAAEARARLAELREEEGK